MMFYAIHRDVDDKIIIVFETMSEARTCATRELVGEGRCYIQCYDIPLTWNAIEDLLLEIPPTTLGERLYFESLDNIEIDEDE